MLTAIIFKFSNQALALARQSTLVSSWFFPAIDPGRNHGCRFLFQGKALSDRRSGWSINVALELRWARIPEFGFLKLQGLDLPWQVPLCLRGSSLGHFRGAKVGLAFMPGPLFSLKDRQPGWPGDGQTAADICGQWNIISLEILCC